MKNLAIIIIALFTFTLTSNAQLLTSLSSKTTGGIIGNVTSIVPQIAFHEANTDLMNQTMLFADATLTKNDNSTILTIDANNGGMNFQNFCTLLTSNEETMLKVGHKINKVKNHVGRSVQDWFENVDLTNEEISKLELVITKVNFDNSTAGWTNFSYEITLNVYGSSAITTDKTITQSK